MIKKVQITEISGRKALSTANNWLNIIGNNPIKPGDWVFADEKCIYGHIDMGGTASVIPIVTGEEIPILSNTNQYATYTNTYKLLGEGENHNGMTNNESYFSFPSDNDLLDADITKSNETYTLHSGSYEYKSNIGYHITDYHFKGYTGAHSYSKVRYHRATHETQSWNFNGPENDGQYNTPAGYVRVEDLIIQGSGIPETTNNPVLIKKGDTILAQINLGNIFDNEEKRNIAMQYANAKIGMLDTGGVPYPAFRPDPPEPSIRNQTLTTLSGKVDSQGNWSLIVEDTTVVRCFPYISHMSPEHSGSSSDRIENFGYDTGYVTGQASYDHNESISVHNYPAKTWFVALATVTNYYLISGNLDTVSNTQNIKSEQSMAIEYDVLIEHDCRPLGSFDSDLYIGDGLKVDTAFNYVNCAADTETPYGTYWISPLGGYWTLREERDNWIENMRIIVDQRTPYGHQRWFLPRGGVYTSDKTFNKDIHIPISPGFYGVLDNTAENIVIYNTESNAIITLPWNWTNNINCLKTHGKYLVGTYSGDLYECSTSGNNKLVTKLNNYRLRKMRTIKKWKKQVNQTNS